MRAEALCCERRGVSRLRQGCPQALYCEGRYVFSGRALLRPCPLRGDESPVCGLRLCVVRGGAFRTNGLRDSSLCSLGSRGVCGGRSWGHLLLGVYELCDMK